jgi:uncharacterized membrane protein YedE/YeeE
MYTYIVALVLGVFFGFALNKAGLTRYTKIVNQFRLTDMAVLKFMMTALVVTMLGVYPLRALGLITFPTVPATYILGNVVGGLVFGVGMALAGFCPGTCVAGAGEGKLDYIVPGLLGFLVGAIFTVSPISGCSLRSPRSRITAVLLSPICGTSTQYLAVFVFAAMALVLFYLIDRMGMHRKQA